MASWPRKNFQSSKWTRWWDAFSREWETDPPAWLTKFHKGGSLGYLGLLDLGPVEKVVAPDYVFGGNCFLPKHLVFSLGDFILTEFRRTNFGIVETAKDRTHGQICSRRP